VFLKQSFFVRLNADRVPQLKARVISLPPISGLMNFEKYSKNQFESLGLNSPAARKLADELQDDVNAELHAAVLPAFLSIVERLNNQGHHLEMYDEICVGDIPFRDEPIDGQCHLRLACNTVISAGYANTMTVDEIDAELAKDSA
jgi:hypothetical protein